MGKRSNPIQIGNHFGKWTVIKEGNTRVYIHRKRIHHFQFFLCRCECGIESEVGATLLRRGRSKSCKQCSIAKLKLPFEKTCIECGSLYLAKNVMRRKCPKCRGCLICGKHTHHYNNRFCSQTCRGIYFRGPDYGHRKCYRKGYQGWRRRVLKRDHHTCQRCGESNAKYAHHIKRWADYPKLRLVLSNGITLCRRCHTKEHRKERWFYFRKSEHNV